VSAFRALPPALGALAVFTAACGITGPDSVRRPGVVAYGSEPAYVVAPDTVEIGVKFVLLVRTYGGGCVEKGDTEVTVSGGVIEVRPYDIDTNYATCAGLLLHFSHEAAASVESPGDVLLRVYGREEPSGAMVVLERQLVAR